MINDLNLLKVFYFVARSNNISKAAEKLYISQPAVSQSIKQLESELGIKLFIRQPKGVKLTPEGEEIYNHCHIIFNELTVLEQSIDDMKNLDSGVLRIGASDTICKYYLIDILKSFEALYPKIRYRVTNCTTSQSLELLKNKDVDIAFIHTPFPNSDFKFQNCLELEDVFVCSYQFDDSKIKSLSDIVNYRILLLEDASYSRKLLDRNLAKYNITLKPKFELASLDLLIEFCKKNMGIICVAKEYIQKELENKELKIINISEKLDKRYISIATDKKYTPKAAKRFIEHIEKTPYF